MKQELRNILTFVQSVVYDVLELLIHCCSSLSAPGRDRFLPEQSEIRAACRPEWGLWVDQGMQHRHSGGRSWVLHGLFRVGMNTCFWTTYCMKETQPHRMCLLRQTSIQQRLKPDLQQYSSTSIAGSGDLNASIAWWSGRQLQSGLGRLMKPAHKGLGFRVLGFMV